MSHRADDSTGRNAHVIRICRLIRLLEGARVGYTARQLAQEFDVCYRTILRDLEAIEVIGFPLLKEGPRWRMFDWRRELGNDGRRQSA